MVVSYEGTTYHGWQAQKHHSRTIQQTVQAALGKVAAQPVEVVCAGRTDAGVHATAQVLHFDTLARRNAQAWVSGVNHFLPDDIAMRWAGGVGEDFHARYSARSRTYRYFILNTRFRSAVAARNMTWFSPPLDAEKMANAGRSLLGEQDFSSFRDAECQAKTPFRHLLALDVRRQGDVVVLEVQANAFLHHMVRNITGTLLEVGTGRKPAAWVADVLQARQRCAAGVTAPPQGLYFVNVDYPQHFGIPVFAKGPVNLAGA
jgi:tRNA pseudouridine38-40 synthase